VERREDRRTRAASAGLAAWAERRLANEGPVEDLARIVCYAEQVTVGPAVRGRNRFDPDRVTIEWRQR
jgi:hypothetical protein